MKRIYYAALYRPTFGARPEIDPLSIRETRGEVRGYVDRKDLYFLVEVVTIEITVRRKKK